MDPLGSAEVGFGGTRLFLLPDRAVYWPDECCLIVADIHIGKAATFRHHGLAIPEGDTATDLERLSKLIVRTGAEKLIIAGDLLHAAAAKTSPVRQAVTAWRQQHSSLEIVLVSGNHDKASGTLPDDWKMIEHPNDFALPPISFVHDPADVTDTTMAHVCGHLHPAIRLSEGRLRSLVAPCFWLRPSASDSLVVPGFGSFTGSKAITPAKTDQVFAVAGNSVIEVTPQLLADRAR